MNQSADSADLRELGLQVGLELVERFLGGVVVRAQLAQGRLILLLQLRHRLLQLRPSTTKTHRAMTPCAGQQPRAITLIVGWWHNIREKKTSIERPWWDGFQANLHTHVENKKQIQAYTSTQSCS